MAKGKTIGSMLDMALDARMARAKEMGFDVDNIVTHASNKRFIGGGNDMSIPREEEFKSKYGGIYFSKRGESADFDMMLGDFGEEADYLLRGNKLSATYKEATDEQKKDIMEAINDSFSSDDIEEIRERIGDSDWSPYESFMDGELWADTSRDSQDRVLERLFKKYDVVKYKDNPSYGTDSISYVAKSPSNIRSVNAAFDPSKKDSSNLMAGVAPVGVGLGGYLLSPEEAFASIPVVPNPMENIGHLLANYQQTGGAVARAPVANNLIGVADAAQKWNDWRENNLPAPVNFLLPGQPDPEYIRNRAYGREPSAWEKIKFGLSFL